MSHDPVGGQPIQQRDAGWQQAPVNACAQEEEGAWEAEIEAQEQLLAWMEAEQQAQEFQEQVLFWRVEEDAAYFSEQAAEDESYGLFPYEKWGQYY